MTITTLGAFPGANATDRNKRIPAALNALNKALAGDMAALDYMRSLSVSAATAVGKDAFVRALAIYDANKPAAQRPSTATAPVGLQPIPRATPTPDDLIQWPVVPPDARIGWRLDLQKGWVFTPPQATPGIQLITTQPKPIGFDNEHEPIMHVPPSLRVSGAAPGKVVPIAIGSPDGGVITGPPAPEYSGPVSAALAPPGFGYSAAAAPTTPIAGPTPSATATAKSPSEKMVLLVLLAGVALWLFGEHKRR